MKSRQYVPIVIIFALAIAIILFYRSKPQPEKEYKKISGPTQGTIYNITYEYDIDKELKPVIEDLLHKFDMSLSTYIDSSLISQINKNVKVVPDSYFRTVFTRSKEIFEETDGAFDITIAPLVHAWGFGSLRESKIDTLSIDSLLMLIGMDKVKLKNKAVIKENPGIRLDVNAIAQGYSVDVVAAFLEKKGVENYLVEIGGELKAKGLNPKSINWKIGIDKPIEGNLVPGENLQAIIEISGKSLATSGNYRKFYEMDGVKFVHSINPKTGYPVMSRLLSTTVIADDCMTADAYATAFMVMGLEKTIDFMKTHSELDVYLVYSDEHGLFQTYKSKGIEDFLVKEIE